MNKTILVIVALISLLAVSCAADDSSKTKLDLCLSLVNSYCSQSDKVGCDYPECKTEQGNVCRNTFDGSCEASVNEIFMFEDEIPTGWIQSKNSCAALESIESSVEMEVTNMANSPCTSVSANNDSSDKTAGQLCDQLLDGSCQKLVNLQCSANLPDVATCKTVLYQSNIMALTTVYTCTSPNDNTKADAVMLASYEANMKDVSNATTCADFGF